MAGLRSTADHEGLAPSRSDPDRVLISLLTDVGGITKRRPVELRREYEPVLTSAKGPLERIPCRRKVGRTRHAGDVDVSGRIERDTLPPSQQELLMNDEYSSVVPSDPIALTNPAPTHAVWRQMG